MSTCLVQWRDCDDGKELLFSLVANIVRQYLAWFQVWSFTFTLYKTEPVRSMTMPGFIWALCGSCVPKHSGYGRKTSRCCCLTGVISC